MDLGAYAQIKDLSKIAKDNDIVVPRLRGYRLMKDEEPITKEDLQKLIAASEIDVCERLCHADPYWCANSGCSEYSSRTKRLCDYYLIKDMDENRYDRYIGIRWDRIHGKRRKTLKFEIKKRTRHIQKQFELWNKYAGKENVLYIHARIGGPNWNFFDGNALTKLPWFLDKVDDHYDNTYCDIYAAIK